MMSRSPRPYELADANYRQLLDYRPNLAILPWGATEAHNYHLPHGTDFIQAAAIATEAARIACTEGAKPIVLPSIPFGNNAQQLDQVATIHISTATSLALLRDVALSLTTQGIDRLVILNGHGGNEFKPMVRDVQREYNLLIVVVNFWLVAADLLGELFEVAGDHANEMETSLLMYLRPDTVVLDQAGKGETIPFQLKTIQAYGGWTPRPWSHVHPDTGSGDPAAATAEKGKQFFEATTSRLAKMFVELSQAQRGQVPYV
jgi:creatinine amidohydrolase